MSAENPVNTTNSSQPQASEQENPHETISVPSEEDNPQDDNPSGEDNPQDDNPSGEDIPQNDNPSGEDIPPPPDDTPVVKNAHSDYVFPTPTGEKVKLSEFTQLPAIFLEYFESDTDNFKFENVQGVGDSWHKRYTGPKEEITGEVGYNLDGTPTNPIPPSILAEMNESMNWDLVGAIIDITGEEPKLLYLHNKSVGYLTKPVPGKSELDIHGYGTGFTVKFDSEGNIDELESSQPNHFDHPDVSRPYWEYIDAIKADE